jgi:hypothetical protein
MPRRDLRHRYGFAAAIATLAALAACSDSIAPNDPGVPIAPNDPGVPIGAPAQPAPANSRDGLWAGFTAEGYPVSFAVDGDLIKDLAITLTLAGDCDIQVYTARVNATADPFVRQVRVGDGPDIQLSIKGQFADDNADVAGTASLNYSGTLADGTVCNSTGATTWVAHEKLVTAKAWLH